MSSVSKVLKLNNLLSDTLAQRFQSVGILAVNHEDDIRLRVCCISSFDCISMNDGELPLCIFKLNTNSSTGKLFIKSGKATFNFLASEQLIIAEKFRKATDIDCENKQFIRDSNFSILKDAHSSFQLELRQVIEVRNSKLFINEIVDAIKNESHFEILQYRNRSFVGQQ
jgi:flavin reductase (DIM6/NTAB) family NADH-FMN oxidoreductase RutF